MSDLVFLVIGAAPLLAALALLLVGPWRKSRRGGCARAARDSRLKKLIDSSKTRASRFPISVAPQL